MSLFGLENMPLLVLIIFVCGIFPGCNQAKTPSKREDLVTRNLLDLNDAKWAQYATRSGTGAELAALLQASPKNDDVYYHILHECCDLQTFAIYPAAYAAFPHLESIAFVSNDPKEAQWPLSICAAICANFKTSHDKSEVPPELWDNFIDAVNLSAQTAAAKIPQFPSDDPSFMQFMMIQPVLQNIETKPLFGKPQPNSFVLNDWFEERRPKELAK